jgi:AcrR family transcriptional regulator
VETIDFSGVDIPEKQQKILQAAIAVFSEKGFSAATTREIARNAGVAEGTIFRYFKTKKDILRGILVQMINIMSGKLVIEPVEKILQAPEDKDIRAILKELLYDRLKLMDSVFSMARVILTEALFHEDVRETLYQNIIQRALSAFRVFYDRMVERGVLRNDVSPETLFRSILSNLGIFIAQRKLFGDKFPVENMEKELDSMVDVILFGITAQRRESKNP